MGNSSKRWLLARWTKTIPESVPELRSIGRRVDDKTAPADEAAKVVLVLKFQMGREAAGSKAKRTSNMQRKKAHGKQFFACRATKRIALTATGMIT